MEASTIHRLVGLDGFIWDNEIKEVTGDFLIVDEASMVDAYLFCSLLTAVDNKMNILIVGDYEQLPSVGAGLILRDLIKSGRIPTTQLVEIFRQAQDSQIVMNSFKLKNGEKTTDKNGIAFDTSKEDFYFIENYDDMKAQRTIIECVKRFVQQGHPLTDIQILSPIKKGSLGVDELNRLAQDQFNPADTEKAEIKFYDSIIRLGDRVIQTVNNYLFGVFNGEVGFVLSISKKDNCKFSVMVDYGDKVVEYSEQEIHELKLGYAMTIHKSQGSEFPIIIMPIHPCHGMMLNRNIIYTAWTRAKQKVVLVGQKNSLDMAIDKIDATIRNSRLIDKISDYIK